MVRAKRASSRRRKSAHDENRTRRACPPRQGAACSGDRPACRSLSARRRHKPGWSPIIDVALAATVYFLDVWCPRLPPNEAGRSARRDCVHSKPAIHELTNAGSHYRLGRTLSWALSVRTVGVLAQWQVEFLLSVRTWPWVFQTAVATTRRGAQSVSGAMTAQWNGRSSSPRTRCSACIQRWLGLSLRRGPSTSLERPSAVYTPRSSFCRSTMTANALSVSTS